MLQTFSLDCSDIGSEKDFIDMYLDEIESTDDTISSFYSSRGLQSLDCVMIDLFIGICLYNITVISQYIIIQEYIT